MAKITDFDRAVQHIQGKIDALRVQIDGMEAAKDALHTVKASKPTRIRKRKPKAPAAVVTTSSDTQ